MRSKSTKNQSQIDADIEVGKIIEKWRPRPIDLEPNFNQNSEIWHRKLIKQSTSNKCRISIPKGRKIELKRLPESMKNQSQIDPQEIIKQL